MNLGGSRWLMRMGFVRGYLDLLLVPLALTVLVAYHAWLWHKVKTQPETTFIGVNSAGRRRWVFSTMKENDKKNILAVQTIRNSIMGSTLMASTSILLCCGLAAILSSTYSVKKPLLYDSPLAGGATSSSSNLSGEFLVALKFVSLLLTFLSSFLCYSLSIRFVNQVNFLVNVPINDDNLMQGGRTIPVSGMEISPEYVARLLEKSFLFNTVGNRIFYAGVTLLVWILGPVLVLLSALIMTPVLYSHDVVSSYKVVNGDDNKGKRMKKKKMGCCDDDHVPPA